MDLHPAHGRGIKLALFTALIVIQASAEIISLGNPQLKLSVDRTGGQMVALVDLPSQQNFMGSTSACDLWKLEFAGVPALMLSPTNAQACRVEKLEGTAPGLRIVWSRFALPEAPELRVEVTLRLDPQQALSRWQLTVEALPERALQQIRFPRVLDLPRLESERLAVPGWSGLLATNPRQVFAAKSPAGRRREFDYPGLCSMQCLAFYSEAGPGLYLACDDTSGYRKSFAIFGQDQTGTNPPASKALALEGSPGTNDLPALNLEIIHLPDRQQPTARRYVLPYAVIIGTFHGDWFDAASIYRAWATNQVWAREGRWKRGLVPSWIADTGLWIWNRGRSPNVLEPALALQREAGLPVSVFWHWWHGCAYDTGFPEYLPPREGEASFASALERAHAQDVHALVYMNQRLWGMTTASWTNENAAVYAVKAADGRIRPEVYNTFTKLPCATMCIATEFWRAKYAGLATEAFNRLGVDGIYMDQACSSLACFDSEHGHPPGGGTYWVNGFKTLAADIRRRCTARGGVVLAGEGCAENWLPHLDLMLALEVSRERYAAPDGWDPIPFFQAVYHGYGAFYGNYSSLTMPPYDDLWPSEFAPQKPLQLLDRKFSRQFYLEQARSFIWGQQPTLANFQPSQFRERPDEIAYVIRIARLRKLSLKFMQAGVMLPPPTVEVPGAETSLSRLSIYAGQQGALKEFSRTVPLALASAWRALDGTVSIAIASIADRTLTPTIMLDAAKCGLLRGGRFHAIGDREIAIAGELVGSNLVLRPTLEPLAIQVLEWKPDF